MARMISIICMSLVLVISLGCGSASNSTLASDPPGSGGGLGGSLQKSTFVYVSNSGSNNVSGFEVNPTSGALTPVSGSPFPTPSTPTGLATDSSGNILVVANAASQVSVFRIDRTSGALTPVPGSPFPGHGQPNAVAVDSENSVVYVGNRGTNDISAYRYNSTTGVLTELPDSPWPSAAGAVNSLVAFNLAGVLNVLDVAGDGGLSECTLAVGGSGVHCEGDPPYGQIPTAAMTHSAPHTQHPVLGTGYLIYTIAGGQIVGYDQSAPYDNFYDVPTPGSPFSAGAMPSALTATINLLFVADSQSNNVSVFHITTESGGVAFVGHFPAGTSPTDLKLGSAGRSLFVANSGSNDVSAFKVDPATGVLAPVSGTFPAGTAPSHITSTP